MRLVAWNTNHNCHRNRSLNQCIDLLGDFKADVLVLSEVALPPTNDPGKIEQIGNYSPGLVVVARNDFLISQNPLNGRGPDFFGAITVVGRVTFELLAAWPLKPYPKVLMDGLNLFASTVFKKPVIMAGDLNISPHVVGQEKAHPDFIASAQKIELSSVYHHMTGEAHGQETIPTFFCPDGPFHIDYCFVSSGLLPSASLGIHRGERWRSNSDHLPLVLDIPDSSF